MYTSPMQYCRLAAEIALHNSVSWSHNPKRTNGTITTSRMLAKRRCCGSQRAGNGRMIVSVMLGTARHMSLQNPTGRKVEPAATRATQRGSRKPIAEISTVPLKPMKVSAAEPW